MSKLYQNTYPKGVFPMLDEMNEKKHNWFSYEHNKVLFEVSFITGSGGTYLHYLVDEESGDPVSASVYVEDVWLATSSIWSCDYHNNVLFERIDNPNPTQKLKIYLRELKLERILKTTTN